MMEGEGIIIEIDKHHQHIRDSMRYTSDDSCQIISGYNIATKTDRITTRI